MVHQTSSYPGFFLLWLKLSENFNYYFKNMIGKNKNIIIKYIFIYVIIVLYFPVSRPLN